MPNDIDHLLILQAASLGVHGTEQDAVGNRDQQLKVGSTSGSKRVKIFRLHNQVLRVRTLPISQSSVTAEAMGLVEGLAIIRIPAKLLRRNPAIASPHANNNPRHYRMLMHHITLSSINRYWIRLSLHTST